VQAFDGARQGDRFHHRRRPSLLFAAVKSFPLILALSLAAPLAHADPGYYVVTPYPDAGLRTIDLRYWTFKPDGYGEILWPEIGFGYGVTNRWTTELFASWISASTLPTHISSWNWSNDLMLTQGEWPIDLALHSQLIRNRDVGSAIEFGPVMQTDVGRTQVTFNLFWDHAFNTVRPRPTELKLQWQLRYRWQRGLHLGAQGFSELGPWKDWLPARQQSHRAGPALFGQVQLAPGRTLN
jgi:hypothetical protein